jgi:hypothetical protein
MPTQPLLVAAGIACLVVGTVLMRRQIPSEDRPPPAWLQTDVGSTTLAMGTFVLLVAGVGLIIKGV